MWSLLPVSSRAQWVPYYDPSLWVRCHGQITFHPKSLGCYIPCSSASTGKVVPFDPWRADGHLRDNYHNILVPCCARSLLIVSITCCDFFSLLICGCGVVSAVVHPGASASAVSARKAVRGFDVSGQLSSV